MSKKHIFLLLIFAFLSFTQKSYAQNLPLSTQKPRVSEESATSVSKVSVSEPSAASAEPSATSTNKTAAFSTQDATQTKASPLSTQDQISDASAAVSTEEPPVTNQTATSTSQNQTSENEIPKSPNKSQEPKEKQESFVGKNIFSFELAYLRNALKNNGWGIGLSFEQSLFQFFSVKGRFSHVTMFPKDLDFNITTVGIGAEILFYPFRNGLDKLYFGFGNETDFYMYLSSSPENSKDTIITIYPKIGWKQNFFNLVFLDLFVSYNFFLSEVPTLSSNINLLERGINYGAKFKFNLSEIWTFVKKSFSS